MFQSLSVFNYRVWFVGALISNIGVWMHRTAQDWIVLTELTDFDAVQLGYVGALQYLPALVLMPVTGMVTDRFDKRKLLMLTQVLQFALAAVLAVLTLLGGLELWHMYLFAFGLGLITAFDQPARQTIVGYLVEDRALTNAVALNQTSMHGARLAGPALAGLVVASIGPGWAFGINAIATAGMLVALVAMRRDEIRSQERVTTRFVDFFRGFSYIARRSDLRMLFIMTALFGMVGFNFSLSVTTLTAVAFEGDAFQLGLVSTGSAMGGLVGSLMVARGRARWRYLAVGGFGYGVAWIVAVSVPEFWMFLLAMLPAGVASQLFQVGANSYAQLATEPQMRGRVMALFQGIQTGMAPVGALVMGWMIAELGPRLAVGIATGVAGFGILAVAMVFVLSTTVIRVRHGNGVHVTISLEPRRRGER